MEFNPKSLMWLGGGLLVAIGILTAVLGGFGMPQGPTSTVFSQLGADGLDHLTIFPRGYAAIAMFVAGVALMGLASKNAWKDTGGY